MNLRCLKCGSDRVIYGPKEHPTNGATWWVFECRGCSAIWRPAQWRNEPPIAVTDHHFEAVIDEVRTAIAGECSCSFAPCFHTGIVEIIAYEQQRSAERSGAYERARERVESLLERRDRGEFKAESDGATGGVVAQIIRASSGSLDTICQNCGNETGKYHVCTGCFFGRQVAS